jgi:hypothetical protein
MNTGIQDGYNLAWKLALVLRGEADAKILDTYDEERGAVAKRLLETTDRMFDLLMDPAWPLSFTRRFIFPRVANFIVGLDSVNHFIFPLISQTGIHYRESALSAETSADFEVKAGDRMPYFLVQGKSVYDSLHAPKFHLLTFSNEPDTNQRTEIEKEFTEVLDYHAFALSEEIKEIFNTTKPFSVLLRPDNYIGFVSAAEPLTELTNYFATVIGRPHARSAADTTR